MEKAPRKENNFEKINSFAQLFEIINSSGLDQQSKAAYEQAAQIAKNFVEQKNKSSWNSNNFGSEFRTKYPGLSQDFIKTLARCIEGYNPPVNIPAEPLW